MGARKKDGDPRVEAYKRIRKRIPPPERVERDRRRKIREREAAREIDRAEREK